MKNWSKPSVNTARKKHILFLSYYFPPMGGGGVQRILKFLKYWDYISYDVSLVTVKPSYFYAEDQELLNDIPAEVKVHRTGSLDPFRLLYLIRNIFPAKKNPTKAQNRESGILFRKIAGFLFVPDSRLLWLPFVVHAVRKIHKRHPIDLIVGSMPPFTTGLAAIASRLFFRIPAVLDLRDSWTNNPYLPDVTSFHAYLQKKLEKVVLGHANGIVFVNDHLEKYYLERYPARASCPFRTIRNGYDPEDFSNREYGPRLSAGIFHIGIMGTVYSQGNAPSPLFEAISGLVRESPSIKQKLGVVLLGKWAEDFVSHVKSYGIDEIITWVNYLPHRQALSFIRQVDVLALAIDSRMKGSRNVIPGRTYEYLYLRKPILAMCPPDGDLARVVHDCDAGEAVEFTDVKEIQRILKMWIENPPGLRKQYGVRNIENFSREQLTSQLMDFISKM